MVCTYTCCVILLTEKGLLNGELASHMLQCTRCWRYGSKRHRGHGIPTEAAHKTCEKYLSLNICIPFMAFADCYFQVHLHYYMAVALCKNWAGGNSDKGEKIFSRLHFNEHWHIMRIASKIWVNEGGDDLPSKIATERELREFASSYVHSILSLLFLSLEKFWRSREHESTVVLSFSFSS